MNIISTDEWIIYRKYFKPEYTIGRFYLDAAKLCDTLEPQTRDFNADGDIADEGEGNIAGKTAINYGRYKVISYYSPKFKRYLPLLVDVIGFSYIEIHAINTHKDTKGCIGVGENTKPGVIFNSGYYVNKLVDRLLFNEKEGVETYLTIKKCAS